MSGDSLPDPSNQPPSDQQRIIRRQPERVTPRAPHPDQDGAQTSIIRRHPTGAFPVVGDDAPPTSLIARRGTDEARTGLIARPGIDEARTGLIARPPADEARTGLIGGPGTDEPHTGLIGGPGTDEPHTGLIGRPGADEPHTAYVPRARPVVIPAGAHPRTAVTAAVLTILSGWATAVIATDLITGWWQTDRLFCVAVGFLAAISAAASIGGVILLLLRLRPGRLLIVVGSVIGLLIFASLFVAGASLPPVVYAIPVLPLASIGATLLPSTRRWIRAD